MSCAVLAGGQQVYPCKLHIGDCMANLHHTTHGVSGTSWSESAQPIGAGRASSIHASPVCTTLPFSDCALMHVDAVQLQLVAALQALVAQPLALLGGL